MLDIKELIETRKLFNFTVNLYREIDEERKYLMGERVRTREDLARQELKEEILDIPEPRDEWIDLIIANKDFANKFIITQAYGVRKLLDNNFFVKSIFEFGDSLYSRTMKKHFGNKDDCKDNAWFDYLIQISKSKPSTLNVGIWKGKKYTTDDELSNSFLEYISVIEKFINNNDNRTYIKQDMEIKTINTKGEFIPYMFVYPRYFTEKAIKARERFKNEKCVELSSVAIILPIVYDYVELPPNSRQICYVDDLINNHIPKTNSIFGAFMPSLNKWDIIIADSFREQQTIHLISYDIDKNIYACNMTSGISYVIRPNGISPEYLYLYLTSEMGQVAVKCYGISEKLPILLPKNDETYYKDIFNTKILNERNYTQISQTPKEQALTQIILDAKNKGEFKVDFIDELVAKGESLGDILDAELLADNIKLHDTQLKEFVKNDINELNICFKNGAYKATLALAGSILEVFLIDWLSEIHGRDYFNETYRVSGKCAVLVDYIDAIKEIKKPEWMQEANKAHSIREKRNLLHAKLCLKSDEINEKVCKEVIEYLQDIIKTRGI